MKDFSPADFISPIQGCRPEQARHRDMLNDANEWLDRFWVYLPLALANRAFVLLEDEASINGMEVSKNP